jgi:hypothetical protein
MSMALNVQNSTITTNLSGSYVNSGCNESVHPCGAVLPQSTADQYHTWTASI